MQFPLKTSFRIHDSLNFNFSDKDIDLFIEITDFVKKIDTFGNPDISLEQYSLPDDLIAFLLILSKKDLYRKNVVDLGCGTGRFSLPIAKYFSDRVLAVDSDPRAINQLQISMKSLGTRVDILNSFIEFLETNNWSNKFHTTIMNPPFGTQRRGIDQVFLRKALKFSRIVLSIHKSNAESRRIWKRIATLHSKEIEVLATIDFPLERTFFFHRNEKHEVKIDLIRIFS
jgi:putative methylase